jgi:hypothetical protein
VEHVLTSLLALQHVVALLVYPRGEQFLVQLSVLDEVVVDLM